MPNIDSHYEEVFGEKPDIDWDLYTRASHAGFCPVVTARLNGRIIGYSAYVLSHNMRKRKVIEAENHGLYIEKKYRGKIGRTLLRKADEFLKRFGVHETMYRNDNALFGEWIARCGYTEKCKIWSIKYGQ